MIDCINRSWLFTDCPTIPISSGSPDFVWKSRIPTNMRRNKNNHDFEICFDKYTGAPNRVYLIETDTQKT